MKTLKKVRASIAPSLLFFDRISTKITRAAGSATAFFTAIIIVLMWLVTGPVFQYSNTWQLIINTGTTVVTFLMVFLIQQSQNKDTTALHLKLNELIACNREASNKLVAVELLTDQELQILKEFYMNLAKKSENDMDLYSTHSLNEAEKNRQGKIALRNRDPKKEIHRAEA